MERRHRVRRQWPAGHESRHTIAENWARDSYAMDIVRVGNLKSTRRVKSISAERRLATRYSGFSHSYLMGVNYSVLPCKWRLFQESEIADSLRLFIVYLWLVSWI